MSSRSELRRPLRAGSVGRGALALWILLGAGALLAGCGLLATSGYLISRAAQHPEVLALGVAIAAVRAFGLKRALFRYAERLVSHDVAFAALARLRTRFFTRLVPLVPSGLDGVRRADLLSRFVADVERLQDLYLRVLGPPVIAAISCAAAVAAAAWMLPQAAVALGAGLLYGGIAVPVLTRRIARSAGRRQAAARAQLTVTMVEAVRGAPEIALAGREHTWLERVTSASACLTRLQLRDAAAGGLGAGLTTAIGGLTVLGVALAASPAVHDGRLPGVLLAAVLLLTLGSFEAIAPLVGAAAGADACASAAGRLADVTDRPPDIHDPADPEPAGEPRALRVRALSYGYPSATQPVLSGLDLDLRRGRSIALGGASGSGKSTLAELLVRFRDPTGGEIALDGIPLPALRQDDVRAAIAYGAQDAYLFATTIRENLSLGRPEAADSELWAVLRRVGLDRWARDSGGLATPVGEEGALLSGGQRQRLGAARLLLSRAPFLIFDEPTAHLDEVSAEALLTELALTARREDRGVLVITHEPGGLSAFDEVLELTDGSISPTPTTPTGAIDS